MTSREFSRVFSEYFDFVWRVLRTFGVPESQLDDAVQDVFVTVHGKLGEFEGRSKLGTWIYSVAHNTARNYGRKAQRSRCDELDVDLASSEPSPSDHVETRDAVRFVENFLQALDPEQRDVFVLCVLEEVSVPDAAAMLGAKLNTVYSRLRLARKKFRETMNATGYVMVVKVAP